jgi:hypothetical protein
MARAERATCAVVTPHEGKRKALMTEQIIGAMLGNLADGNSEPGTVRLLRREAARGPLPRTRPNRSSKIGYMGVHGFDQEASSVYLDQCLVGGMNTEASRILTCWDRLCVMELAGV